MYDLESYIRGKAIPHSSCRYKLSKISAKYNRDIREKEYQKCSNDCFVFKVTNCVSDMLDQILEFKGKAKKSKLTLLNII